MSESLFAGVERRRFVFSAASALAGAGAVRSLAWAEMADTSEAGPPLPAPEPIRGGLAPGVHVFVPGPREITLPFSGLTLQGLNVEPSTITNYRGKTAMAYVVGEAVGSDGVTYGLEVDIRAFMGEYVAGDGSTKRGSFAFV